MAILLHTEAIQKLKYLAKQCAYQTNWLFYDFKNKFCGFSHSEIKHPFRVIYSKSESYQKTQNILIIYLPTALSEPCIVV